MLNQNVDALLVLLGAICLLIHAIQLELLSIFILEILSILTGTKFFSECDCSCLCHIVQVAFSQQIYYGLYIPKGSKPAFALILFLFGRISQPVNWFSVIFHVCLAKVVL